MKYLNVSHVMHDSMGIPGYCSRTYGKWPDAICNAIWETIYVLF